MFKGFGKQEKLQQKKRKFEYQFKHVMGEQVAAARKVCIEADVNPEFGQSLITLATGADFEGWIGTPGFQKMRAIIFETYGTLDNFDKLVEVERELQKVKENFVPKLEAAFNNS